MTNVGKKVGFFAPMQHINNDNSGSAWSRELVDSLFGALSQL